MNLELTSSEQRVIGCLIEKSITTPDQYPLSLNALTNACNQKSNREPVMNLSEDEVQNTLDDLASKHLVMTQAGATSRVAKYQHRFCNTEFSDIQLTKQELGIICVLFLRGPQTPGELRTRTNRLCEFTNVAETEEVLQAMCNKEKGAYVVRLEREPGRRESRYQHCFGSPAELLDSTMSEPQMEASKIYSSDEPESVNRIEALEQQVELMQMEIDELREKIDTLLN
ncbi:MAG: DUF480 domain-containing protein [Kangiellaceae bacterium]|nr:DUF480 domain-containing protein [Kangiellaceae bacterium]